MPTKERKSWELLGSSSIFLFTLSAMSGGKISIKVVAASLLIELFLIAPRGRSAYVMKAKS